MATNQLRMLERDECTTCGDARESLARPGRCLNEGCNGEIKRVLYISYAFHLEVVDATWERGYAEGASEMEEQLHGPVSYEFYCSPCGRYKPCEGCKP